MLGEPGVNVVELNIALDRYVSEAGSLIMAAWIQASLVLAVVVGLHVPLGDYMARALDGGGALARAERALYRVCGIDPDKEQTWRHYLTALLAFSVMSIAALFALFTLQGKLPWSTGHEGMPWRLALHTAVSFTTNTSWQNYAGESTTGHLAVMAGLGVQAFASAAVGICVALALVRGLVRRVHGRPRQLLGRPAAHDLPRSWCRSRSSAA